MTALTRFVLRHKALVALFWVVVAAVGVMTISGTTHRMTNNFSMPGQAFKVDNQIASQYGNGGDQTPYVPVITVPGGERITDPAVAAATGRAFGALARAIPDVRIADYATTHNPAFITRDGRSTFALVYTATVSGFGGPNLGPVLERTVAVAVPADWHVGVTGAQLLANGSSQAKGTGIMTEAMIGSVGSLVILTLVFASFLALLPLVIGGISVLATFLLVGGLTEVTGVSQIVEFLIALIGLGVAIDYSLLVVSRWREERAAGRDNQAAVLEAMNHAGRAVVFSGLTVAIGLLSMIILPVPMLRSVGYGGVLVPLVSVLVAITLLPVILATIGPRLDWPRLRTERRASRVFSAWARAVYKHRWVAALAGLGILTALMLPALSLHLGEPGSSAQATSGPAHSALATLTDGGVPSGIITPAEVLVSGGHEAAAAVAGLAARVPGVYAAVAPATPDYQRGATSVVTVIPSAESGVPSGPGHRLRAGTHPAGQPARDRGGRRRCVADRLRPRGLRRLPSHAGHHRRRHLPAPDPGLPVGAAGGQGRGVQPDLAGRRVRRADLGVAGRPRLPRVVGHPGHRSDHHVGAADGVRLPVRPVHGLRGVHPEPHPGGLRRQR